MKFNIKILVFLLTAIVYLPSMEDRSPNRLKFRWIQTLSPIIDGFRRLQNFAIARMISPAVWEIDSLLLWRVKILVTFLLTGIVFASFALVAALFLAINENIWALPICDSLGYLTGFGLLFLRGPSYEARAAITLLVVYVVGLAILVTLGPLSGGPIWLFAFAVFAGVFFGPKAATASVFLNGLTLSIVGWLMLTGHLGRAVPFFKTPGALVTTVVNFLLLNLLAATSVSVLVKGLHSSHQKEKELTGSLAIEREHLVKAKNRLEIEIEERMQAEAAVRESEHKYRLLADNVSDIIWMMDLSQHRFTYVSPSVKKVRGYLPEETMAQTLKEILTPASYRKILKTFGPRFLKDERSDPDRVYTMEIEQYKRDGGTVWTETTVSFIRDDSRRPISVLGVMRDITERRRSEQEKAKLETQLRQAKKMEAIGTLAGGIAHDFNNILSSIIGFTELAMDDTQSGTLLDDNLQEIFIAGKRARDLVKQILAFARQSDDEVKPIQVASIAKETLKLIRSSIPATIQIKSNIQSQSLILGNATQVHQLFMNLCTNAAHAMEQEGGVLKVGLRDVGINEWRNNPALDLTPGNYLQLTVSDTGAGIPPEILNCIFDPYFTTKEAGKGTGMGLAMVHGIVECYGGKILVDSELEKGTLFTIYLPVTVKQEAQAHPACDSEGLPRGAERILFVDDEAPIANMGGQMLERLGYGVSVRTSSLDALALFRKKPDDFDLIITDMTMPNMTGDKLANELVSIRPDIPVILCTGYSNKISAENAATIGIKAFAFKPIVKADLAKMVRTVLDGADGR